MSQEHYIVTNAEDSHTYSDFTDKPGLQESVDRIAEEYSKYYEELYNRLFTRGGAFSVFSGAENATTISKDPHQNEIRKISLKKSYIEANTNELLIPTLYHEMFHSMQFASSTFFEYVNMISKLKEPEFSQTFNKVKWFIEGPASAAEVLHSKVLLKGSRLYSVAKGVFDFSNLSYDAFPIFHFLETHCYSMSELFQFMDDINYLLTGHSEESYMFVDDFIRCKNWCKDNEITYSAQNARNFLVYIKGEGKAKYIKSFDAVLFEFGQALQQGVYDYDSKTYKDYRPVGDETYKFRAEQIDVSALSKSDKFYGVKVLNIHNNTQAKVTIVSTPLNQNTVVIDAGQSKVVTIVNGYELK